VYDSAHQTLYAQNSAGIFALDLNNNASSTSLGPATNFFIRGWSRSDGRLSGIVREANGTFAAAFDVKNKQVLKLFAVGNGKILPGWDYYPIADVIYQHLEDAGKVYLTRINMHSGTFDRRPYGNGKSAVALFFDTYNKKNYQAVGTVLAFVAEKNVTTVYREEVGQKSSIAVSRKVPQNSKEFGVINNKDGVLYLFSSGSLYTLTSENMKQVSMTQSVSLRTNPVLQF